MAYLNSIVEIKFFCYKILLEVRKKLIDFNTDQF